MFWSLVNHTKELKKQLIMLIIRILENHFITNKWNVCWLMIKLLKSIAIKYSLFIINTLQSIKEINFYQPWPTLKTIVVTCYV